MKHLDEMTLLLYIERQLDRARGLEVSAHTQECDACGTLLRALERESRLLTRAMLEEESPFLRGWHNSTNGRASPCNGFGDWFSDWRPREFTHFIHNISSSGRPNWKMRDSADSTCWAC